MTTINTETGEIVTTVFQTAHQSAEIDKLAAALAKAQGQLVSAPRDAENPFFKSSYATLDSIWNVCRGPLSANGLAVVQQTMFDSAGMYLVTTLAHASGQWINSYYRINPAKADPQGIGSALTYARRYAMSALVGISTAEDDDGNAASAPAKNDKAQPEKKTNGHKVAQPAHAEQENGGRFATLDDLLHQLFTDFHLSETDAKNLLKQAGYKTFKALQSDEMYHAVKTAVKHARTQEQPEADQPDMFPDLAQQGGGAAYTE